MKKRLKISLIFFSAIALELISCEKNDSPEMPKQQSRSVELAEKLSFTAYDAVLKEALINDDARSWALLREASGLEPEWLGMVDKTHKLNPLWSPKDLVNLKEIGVPTHRTDITLREPVIQPLLALIREAEKDGIHLRIVSAYRDIAYQQRVWDTSVHLDGLEYTQQYVAVPGTSQHHLGAVIDFNLADEAFNNTPPARWLAQNATKFGFSLSYPEGYEEQTGYSPESWHYRYFPENVLELIDTYFGGLQFTFLDFWFRNGDVIREFVNSDRTPLP